jgi:hypothetical protein
LLLFFQERGDHLFLGPGPEQVMNLDVLHEVEGLCLVMMCSCRVVTRKLAIHLLKEVRNIFAAYSGAQVLTKAPHPYWLTELLHKQNHLKYCPHTTEHKVWAQVAQLVSAMD